MEQTIMNVLAILIFIGNIIDFLFPGTVAAFKQMLNSRIKYRLAKWTKPERKLP